MSIAHENSHPRIQVKCFIIYSTPVLHFIWKPVPWFAVQIKLLVSIWNAKLAWNVLKNSETGFYYVATTHHLYNIVEQLTSGRCSYRVETSESSWKQYNMYLVQFYGKPRCSITFNKNSSSRGWKYFILCV